jgi:hypothetical protein
MKAESWHFDGGDFVLTNKGDEVFRAKNAFLSSFGVSQKDDIETTPISFRITKIKEQ